MPDQEMQHLLGEMGKKGEMERKAFDVLPLSHLLLPLSSGRFSGFRNIL
jgi:hypothetical protein